MAQDIDMESLERELESAEVSQNQEQSSSVEIKSITNIDTFNDPEQRELAALFDRMKEFEQHESGNTNESIHRKYLRFTMEKWNVSHTIKKLSFGDSYPGLTNPLEGTVKSLKSGTGMYQYYTKVVPTEYNFVRPLQDKETIQSKRSDVSSLMKKLFKKQHIKIFL